MELTKTLKLNDVKKLLYEDNALRLFPLPHKIRRIIYAGVQMGSRYDVLNILSRLRRDSYPKTATLKCFLLLQ